MSTGGVGGNDRLERGKRWRGKEGTNPEPGECEREQNDIHHPLAAINWLSVEGV